jgi:tol-pal system protein YbgF
MAHMHRFRNLTAPFLLTVLLAPLAPAHAGIFSDDEARKAILELRDTIAKNAEEQKERLDAMEKRLAEMETRIEAVQNGQIASAEKSDATTLDLDKLRGATERLANDVANTQKNSHDLYADLDQRLRKLEPAAVTVDGRNAEVGRDEQMAYDTAMGQFRANDFRSAINALGAFVARYPQSVYTAAAQYWLGTSYYAVKDFPSAIAAQQALIEHFPDSPRVPEALLNIAASQMDSNDRKAARATLIRITKDYPASEAAKLAQDRLSAMPAEKGKK